jgi:hypothetical protein
LGILSVPAAFVGAGSAAAAAVGSAAAAAAAVPVVAVKMSAACGYFFRYIEILTN